MTKIILFTKHSDKIQLLNICQYSALQAEGHWFEPSSSHDSTKRLKL